MTTNENNSARDEEYFAVLIDALQDAVAFSRAISPQYDVVEQARARWIAALEHVGAPIEQPDLH